MLERLGGTELGGDGDGDGVGGGAAFVACGCDYDDYDDYDYDYDDYVVDVVDDAADDVYLHFLTDSYWCHVDNHLKQ